MKLFPGLEIIDLTAVKNNWPDKFGKVLEVDGSNVKVEYESGNIRWKAAWNIQVSDDNTFEMIKKFIDGQE